MAPPLFLLPPVSKLKDQLETALCTLSCEDWKFKEATQIAEANSVESLNCKCQGKNFNK